MQKVELEGPALLENSSLLEQRRRVRAGEESIHPCFSISLPQEAVTRGVGQAVYEGYRRGLDSACADCVVTTRLENNEPAAILGRRSHGKCHAGQWWMQGGAIHAYRPIRDFLLERVAREIGATPAIEGIIGVYRCAAEDIIGSVLVVCYVGYVELSSVEKFLRTDVDHATWGLYTLRDYLALPPECRYPYAERVISQALTTMPD